jgi:WS/DGAT/MGAT family acyltransferase
MDVEAFVAGVKKLLLDRIHLVPYFTNRLQFVPFNLDHPVWVRDTDFDIDNHVHTIEVPAPGGQKELEAVIARLHETRLDRSKPLWDLWVLTGLEGGHVAYYNRAHHACLDGVSGQAMIETIMDISPEPRAVDPAPEGYFNRETQSPAQLISGAMENLLKYQIKQPAAALEAMETAGRLFRRAFDPSKGLGAVTQAAPATRFNRAVEQRRTYAVGEMPLDSVKAIARVSQTKINDVFLAAVGGGLRRYFERKGELPSKAMIAGCPVSLRKPGDTNPNNQVTMMMVSMATDEANPAERLQTIAGSARTAKGLTGDIAPSYDANVVLPGLPGALTAGLRMVDMTGAANLPGLRLPCNVVVSNVPGPQMALYSAGARVLTHYPVSIPAHSQGVNVTVQSYNGKLFYAITACAKALPDAGELRDDIAAAFTELQGLYDPASKAEEVLDRDSASQQKARENTAQRADSGRQKASEIPSKAA